MLLYDSTVVAFTLLGDKFAIRSDVGRAEIPRAEVGWAEIGRFGVLPASTSLEFEFECFHNFVLPEVADLDLSKFVRSVVRRGEFGPDDDRWAATGFFEFGRADIGRGGEDWEDVV